MAVKVGNSWVSEAALSYAKVKAAVSYTHLRAHET